MTKHDFQTSLDQNKTPAGASPYLLSLWFDAKGDWEKAHTIIQDIDDNRAAAIHAYLHRKEGDLFNASYWYRRAGRVTVKSSLEEEWKNLLDEMLAV